VSDQAIAVYLGYSSLVLKTSNDGDCTISLSILFHCLVVLMVGKKKEMKDENMTENKYRKIT